ncbi:MAG: amidase [Gemmatimonadetes bacterium]|nr:amidase [Gemmatimonadota bacterium]
MLAQSRRVTFNLETATIADINAAFDAGALNSEQLVRMYLARIAAYNENGPKLNAIITLNQNAIEQARALDRERLATGRRSPLHGIPIDLKDVFDTYDMPTSGGFMPMAESRPPRDAFIVKRLRDAGAIILAKMNQADWFGEHRLAESTRKGQVLNPYDLTRIPGNSSAGTGAGQAAYFSALGFGSDTGGSVIWPTADNSLVCILPTSGLTSRAGQIGSTFRRERNGPIGRSIYDVALALSIVAGVDAEDLQTMESIGHVPAEPYTSFLDKDGLVGARIGVLRDMFYPATTPGIGAEHAEGLALIEKAIDDMRNAGAVIVDPVTTGLDLFPLIDEAGTAGPESYAFQNQYLARLGPNNPIRSLEEMAEKGAQYLSPGFIDRVKNAGNEVSLEKNPDYIRRVAVSDRLRQAIVDLVDRYDLDAVVFPYKTVMAPKIGEGRSPGSINRLAAVAGLPAVLVPAGFVSAGLPIAVEFSGKPFSEPTLIKLAYAYEQRTHHRRTPRTTPTLRGEIITYDAPTTGADR